MQHIVESTEDRFSSTSQVAIIGAGPGGLLLARYLQQNSIPCKIYEREPSEHHRTQGGSLDLHEESGQLAIKEAGLMEEFLKYARKEGEEMKVFDKMGKLWFEDVGDQAEHGRPEIDRTNLRKILIDSLEPNTIQWDHHLVSADPLDVSPGYVLKFSNAVPRKTDILIGADGAWSRVRPLVTSVLPVYSSITFIELAITDVETRFPHLASLVGQGIAFIMSDNKGFMPQRNSNGTIRIYVGIRVPENWIDDHPLPPDPAKARQFIQSLFDGWSPLVLDLIKSADDAPMLTRKIIALPPSLTWTTTLHGITLLGDAAHVMSPFAGEGVNLALLDAYEVGRELVDSLSKGFTGQERIAHVDEALRRYERGMWARAQEKGEESASNLDALFAMDAPKAFVEIMKSHGPPPDAE